MSSLQVILPVRSPGAVLLKSIASLVEQTDRNFSVLISDNSPAGEVSAAIGEAVQSLEEAGIVVTVIRPPEVLGRVEHWNWSHQQGTGDWIKPLFAGDWLSPEYIDVTRRQIAEGSGAEIVTCSVRTHFAEGHTADEVWPDSFQAPGEVLEKAYTRGNNIGAPVNVCFRKLAFQMIGGYPPALPIAADFWVMLMLALRGGLRCSSQVLAHFNRHGQRFSSNISVTRVNGDRELFTILMAATSLANSAGIPAPVGIRNRYFFFLLQRRLKFLWRHRRAASGE